MKNAKTRFFILSLVSFGACRMIYAAPVPSQGDLKKLIAKEVINPEMATVYEVDAVTIHKGYPVTSAYAAQANYRADVTVKTKVDCYQLEGAIGGRELPACLSQDQLELEKAEQKKLVQMQLGRPNYTHCERELSKKPISSTVREMEFCKIATFTQADIDRKLADLEIALQQSYPKSSILKAGSKITLRKLQFETALDESLNPKEWKLNGQLCFNCF